MTKIPKQQPKNSIVKAFEKEDFNDLASIYYGIYDCIADHGHGNPNIVVAPAAADGGVDWEKAFPANLEQPSSDSGPADIAEAKRWAVLVDDISGCDDKTSMLIWLNPADGEPNMAQIEGPVADGEIAMRIMGRDVGAAPPVREYKPGPLAQSLAEFMEKRAPANDNLPTEPTHSPADDAVRKRLERTQKRLGGEIVWNEHAKFFFLQGCTYKGDIGHVYVSAKSNNLEFFKDGTKKAIEVPEKRSEPTVATPFTLRDTSEIPPREFLYGRHYLRKYLTATVGAGGSGKSSLSIVEALAMVTGRPLLDPDGGLIKPLRVWYVNIEDPSEEIERRFAAAAKHFGITNDQIGGRLFMDSGRDQEFVIMHARGREFQVCEPLCEELVEEIQKREIDVLIVDPFVSTHQVPENDNNLIQRVASAWVAVANAANCSIEVIHHVTKGNFEVTADSARGGGALKDKTRSMRVINPMTEAEAEKVGIDDHNGYFRVNLGKVNMVPQSGAQRWHRLVSVPLMNGRGIVKTGDEVGVVERWFWPSADVLAEREAEERAAVVADVPEEALAAIKVRLAHPAYKASDQAKNWAGLVVSEVLGIDIADKTEKARVKEMIGAWIATGHFQIVDHLDHRRHLSPHLVTVRDPES